MNTKAQAIGMEHTVFYDPAGNQPVHYKGKDGVTMANLNDNENYWSQGNLWSTPYINTMTAKDAIKLLMYAKSINTLD
jgi:D-alanyl-D-alanine carboxypeptidase